MLGWYSISGEQAGVIWFDLSGRMLGLVSRQICISVQAILRPSGTIRRRYQLIWPNLIPSWEI